MCRDCGWPLDNDEADERVTALLDELSEKQGRIALLDNPDLYVISSGILNIVFQIPDLLDQMCHDELPEEDIKAAEVTALMSAIALIADAIEKYHTNSDSTLL